MNKKEDLKPTDQNLPITPELLSQIDHAVAISFGLDGMLNPKEKEEDLTKYFAEVHEANIYRFMSVKDGAFKFYFYQVNGLKKNQE